MVLAALHRASAEPYPKNKRAWEVLQELEHRQVVLWSAKASELKWKFTFIGCCALSLLTLISRVKYSAIGTVGANWFILWLFLLLLILDGYLFLKLRKVKAKLHKARVNFAVVRHHLVGLLEVGLCDCQSLCDCKEQFKRAAWKNSRVNLY